MVGLVGHHKREMIGRPPIDPAAHGLNRRYNDGRIGPRRIPTPLYLRDKSGGGADLVPGLQEQFLPVHEHERLAPAIRLPPRQMGENDRLAATRRQDDQLASEFFPTALYACGGLGLVGTKVHVRVFRLG